MIKSMTGYGKATGQVNNVATTIELRSLNSKSIDLSMRFPPSYKPYEMDLRNIITDKLDRGKVELNINREDGNSSRSNLNQDLIKHYLSEITALEDEIDSSVDNKLALILNLPDVFVTDRTQADESEFKEVCDILQNALQEIDQYRLQEGKMLEKDLLSNIKNIEKLIVEIPPFAEHRIEKIKDRIRKNINAHLEGIAIDHNRFEQELIYYLEKIDVNEELTRLQGHIDYFRECISNQDSEGKKLRFISQEIGREVNTLGAKSYDVDMQKIVVMMKDELEKIKEQLLNVL